MWQPGKKKKDTKIVVALLGRGNDIPLRTATPIKWEPLKNRRANYLDKDEADSRAWKTDLLGIFYLYTYVQDDLFSCHKPEVVYAL